MSLPPASSSRAGNLIINPSGTNPGEMETPLRCPGWWVLDLSVYDGYPDLRGSNVVVPQAIGVRPFTKRVTETTYVSELYVCGDAGRQPSANPSGALVGLNENLDDLWTNVGDPGVTVTRVAKRVRANGSAHLADVQCRLSLRRTKGFHAWLVLDVIVPAGRFT